MLRAFFISLFLIMPVLAVASGGDIAISEVFFDPSGTDTGLEYIVIKNFGSADVNLGGWDLYPAGVGYFNFPNFTLAHGEEVKIHIRASGSADKFVPRSRFREHGKLFRFSGFIFEHRSYQGDGRVLRALSKTWQFGK